jgi:hypothetical protein
MYGHVIRMWEEKLTIKAFNSNSPGIEKRGKSKKTWLYGVQEDMKENLMRGGDKAYVDTDKKTRRYIALTEIFRILTDSKSNKIYLFGEKFVIYTMFDKKEKA